MAALPVLIFVASAVEHAPLLQSENTPAEEPERQRIACMIRKADRIRSQTGRELMHCMALVLLRRRQRHSDEDGVTLKQLKFDRTEYGKPYCVRYPELALNISHHSDFVLGVGIDAMTRNTTKNTKIFHHDVLLSHSASRTKSDEKSKSSYQNLLLGCDIAAVEITGVLGKLDANQLLPDNVAQHIDSLFECFTALEWAHIKEKPPGRPQLTLFALYWAHKEALTKALGLGLRFPFNCIQLIPCSLNRTELLYGQLPEMRVEFLLPNTSSSNSSDLFCGSLYDWRFRAWFLDDAQLHIACIAVGTFPVDDHFFASVQAANVDSVDVDKLRCILFS